MNRFIWQYLFGAVFIAWLCVSNTAWDFGVAWSIRGVGVLLLFVGIVGRIYATIFIGGMKNEGLDGTKFIDYGAYSLCRNPLYLFSFIAFVGLLALTAQLTLVAIGIAFYLLVYRYTILGEERYLKGRFGAAYEDFLASTSRFLPKFSNFHCPEKIEVRPAFLHKELLRAVNWTLSGVAFVAVGILHSLEILPNFFGAY